MPINDPLTLKIPVLAFKYRSTACPIQNVFVRFLRHVMDANKGQFLIGEMA